MTWIQTYSGKRFSLAHPRPEDVELQDIAHALSYINRFTGHTSMPYSVGMHSLYVSELCSIQGNTIALLGLFHDATEAYVGDMASPLKGLVGEPYQDIEARVAKVIAQKFSLDWTKDCNDLVGQSDLAALAWEARYLLPGGPQHDWDFLPPLPTLPHRYYRLHYTEVEDAFMNRAIHLAREVFSK